MLEILSVPPLSKLWVSADGAIVARVWTVQAGTTRSSSTSTRGLYSRAEAAAGDGFDVPVSQRRRSEPIIRTPIPGMGDTVCAPHLTRKSQNTSGKVGKYQFYSITRNCPIW